MGKITEIEECLKAVNHDLGVLEFKGSQARAVAGMQEFIVRSILLLQDVKKEYIHEDAIVDNRGEDA
jgi:hypothetical protein